MVNRSYKRLFIFSATGLMIVSLGLGLGLYSCKKRNNSKLDDSSEPSFQALTGGSCSTSGQFTQEALSHARKVRSILEQFKDDPKCNAINQALLKLPDGQDPNKSNLDSMSGMNIFAMSQEVQALRRIRSAPHSYKGADGQPISQQTVDSLLNEKLFQMIGVEQSSIVETGDTSSSGLTQVKNDISLALNQKKRILNVAGEAIDAAGNVFEALSIQSECPINQPGVLGSMAIASIKMVGAYAAADPALANKTASAVAKYLKWSNTQYFRNSIAQIDQADLSLGISCLMETTANSYCSVRDNQYLQKDVKEQMNKPAFEQLTQLKGFQIFTKQLPSLNSWLIRFKSSQPARKDGDVNEQIGVMRTPVSIQEKRYQISSLLSKTAFQLDKDISTARTQVFQLMNNINNLLSGPIADGIPEFFDLKYPQQFRLFTLLNLKIDSQCTQQIGAKSQEDVFQEAGFVQIGDPALALNIIQDKVNEMFTTVSGQVAGYLRKFSNQDASDIIASFELNDGVRNSPRQVLINIQNYFLDILEVINKESKENSSSAVAYRPLAVVMVDSVNRIDRVLTLSDDIRKKSEDFFKNGGVDDVLNKRRTSLSLTSQAIQPTPADLKIAKMTTPLGGKDTSISDINAASKENDQNAKTAIEAAVKNQPLAEVLMSFTEFANAVVAEFGMDTFQETLIGNRLARVVQFDMQRLMRQMKQSSDQSQFSPVTVALLNMANELMVDRIGTVYGREPQQVNIDLASAQYINLNTLEALGSTPTQVTNPFGSSNPIANTFKRAIAVLTAKTVGGKDTPQEISKYISKSEQLEDSVMVHFIDGLSKSAIKSMINPLSVEVHLAKTPLLVSKLAWMDTGKAGLGASPSTSKGAIRYISKWMRPDLYWTPNWWSGNKLFTDDQFGSMSTLRATFCMQTLAFPDPSFFHEYCKGAILYSVFEKSEDVDQLARSGKSVVLGANNTPAKMQGLSLIYDHWYLVYEQNEQRRNQSTGTKPINFFQSQRICALYDHFRANQVFFMHKSQMEANDWSSSH